MPTIGWDLLVLKKMMVEEANGLSDPRLLLQGVAFGGPGQNLLLPGYVYPKSYTSLTRALRNSIASDGRDMAGGRSAYTRLIYPRKIYPETVINAIKDIKANSFRHAGIIMRKIVLIVLLLALTSLAQAQGDYNDGLQLGLEAGYNVVQALIHKDNAAYETAAQAWNCLVKTAFESTQATTYLLPVSSEQNASAPTQITAAPAQNNTAQGLHVTSPGPDGKMLIRPSHAFDTSAPPGDINEDWKPSDIILK